MIIINKDNLIDKIRHHGFKVAIVYDGLSSSFDQEKRPYFEKYKENDPEGLVARIENFAKTYPGQFTVVLKHQEGSVNPSQVAVRFDQVQTPGQPQLSLNGFGATQESQEQMEDRLLNKIKAQMRVQMLEHENKALQAKLNGLNSAGGKLANMLEQWIEAKFLGKKVPSLQGTPGTKKATKKATQETEEEEETESRKITPEELKNSMNIILDLLGADTVVKLADKLENREDDTILNMVINYANS